MEACAASRHWARRLRSFGHEARLIPAQFVKPLVETSKSDFCAAEAICEAAQRPTMRFAPLKTEMQQEVLVVQRVRQQFVKQRTQSINVLRAHCAEFGVVAAQGAAGVSGLLELVSSDEAASLPPMARQALTGAVAQIVFLTQEIRFLEKQLKDWMKEDEASQRLFEIPGFGPLSATAISASMGDGPAFRSGRQFAARLGLAPKQHSTGGRTRLGRISKRGDRYLRTLLVHGAPTAFT